VTPNDLASQLAARFGNAVGSPVEFRGEVTVPVTDAERIAEVCLFARDTLDCDFLLDVTGVDNYGQDPRWAVSYHLSGISHRTHLRLKTRVGEEKSELPSVAAIWPTADWHEREIYDLLGIRFRNHPDLRRILMWEGYPYFPLRKDFPLAGRPTQLPEVAFTRPAPLEGGPFVTSSGGRDAIEREPRARSVET
jgi:NADH-quinone oxidoreductase subunit C